MQFKSISLGTLLTRLLIFSTLIFSVLFISPSYAENEITVTVSSEDEITVEIFPAKGKYLILWLSPEYGIREGHRSLARLLTQYDLEIWQANVVESLFMPQGTASLKKLNGQHVADLIKYAHKTSGKKIIVLGDSYASLSVLRGAHKWQEKNLNKPYLIGAILFSPYTFASIPPLGQLPEYMPIVSATNIPIMIYQAKRGGTYSQFKTLITKLGQHGSPVYTRFLPNIMSLFYEDKPTEIMIEKIRPIANNIKKMIPVLEKHTIPAKPVALKKPHKIKSGIDIYLKEYKGFISPLAIKLEDTNGEIIEKNNYKGQVTIINFWATWCPPCVQEIPSLNRLKKKMQGLPFELISINYAEEKKTILEFMKKVNVEFPVLLDKDGGFAKKWNVITYPSTFIIDKEGKIKYGVNAAIEWDDPEFIKKIKALL
ncbi:MAG: TlpA family protein disulfide reductase [Gammaproteobacteria bacterium]|nr:TlpA family protein disulfide reductase [Gammaproteobacteria bacterium]